MTLQLSDEQHKANTVHRRIRSGNGICTFDRLKRNLKSTDPNALSASLSLLEEEGRIAIVIHKGKPFYMLSELLEEAG